MIDGVGTRCGEVLLRVDGLWNGQCMITAFCSDQGACVNAKDKKFMTSETLFDEINEAKANKPKNKNIEASQTLYDESNEAKVSMDHIYDQPDPRAYFRELKVLDYVIPDSAKLIFQTLISRLKRRRGDTVHVLDLGCSYGVNAAILKYKQTMPELYEQWGQKSLAGATLGELAKYGKHLYGAIDDSEDVTIIGLDQAENAVDFAENIGLLNGGLSVNLETEPLPSETGVDLGAVDLVTSTGCVGYITEKSFDRLLPAIEPGHRPWFANFVLRMFPFDNIAKTLGKQGYVTEKLEGRTFVQRQFASAREQEEVIDRLRDRGIDPNAEEKGGCLLAEFYLSRPAKDVTAEPIEHLFAS